MNTDGRDSVRSTLGTSHRRRLRWLAVIGLAVLLLVGTAYVYVRVEWEGADLGDNLASMLNKRMRGRIAIGSIEWQPRALEKLVTGGWVPVVIHDVQVWDDCALSSELDPLDERRLGDPNEDCTLDHRPDPDPRSKRKPRKLLIDAPRIEAEIDVHAALFGNHDLVFRHVRVQGGKYWSVPEEVGDEEYEQIWQLLVEDRAWYDSYRAKTDRRLPLVRLPETRPV